MKIYYLDCDGVLHDDGVYLHPQWGMYMRTAGRMLFEWMLVLEALLQPYVDVKIVLSTSWVHARSFAFAKSLLSTSLQARVVGATFHNRGMRRDEFLQLPRGVQIARDVYRRRPQAWFAIDDDDIGWPDGYRSRLVKTSSAVGLSDPKAQLAVQTMLERLSSPVQ